MTQREFFTAIVNGTINADIQTYAADAIAKLDERNAKRKTKPTKAQEANEAVMAEIVAFSTARLMCLRQRSAQVWVFPPTRQVRFSPSLLSVKR